jgi:hypothetical protein
MERAHFLHRALPCAIDIALSELFMAYKYFIETLKTLRTLKSLRLIGNSPEMA